MQLDVAEANRILEQEFAEWIKELRLRFELVEKGHVIVRMPKSERINRGGGIVCGQALMAMADTAMVFAVASSIGRFTDMATVNQNTSFFRGAIDTDVICDTRILKLGRSLVFGESVMRAEHRPDTVAHATLTYALVNPK